MHRQETRWRQLAAGLHRLAWTLRPVAARLRPRPLWLSMAGLVFVSAAAFAVALPLGLLVTGAACWILEWRITS